MDRTGENWRSRGKNVAELIQELRSFEDQTLEVRISVDDGKTTVPISLVAKFGNVAVLLNAEEDPG